MKPIKRDSTSVFGDDAWDQELKELVREGVVTETGELIDINPLIDYEGAESVWEDYERDRAQVLKYLVAKGAITDDDTDSKAEDAINSILQKIKGLNVAVWNNLDMVQRVAPPMPQDTFNKILRVIVEAPREEWGVTSLILYCMLASESWNLPISELQAFVRILCKRASSDDLETKCGIFYCLGRIAFLKFSDLDGQVAIMEPLLEEWHKTDAFLDMLVWVIEVIGGSQEFSAEICEKYQNTGILLFYLAVILNFKEESEGLKKLLDSFILDGKELKNHIKKEWSEMKLLLDNPRFRVAAVSMLENVLLGCLEHRALHAITAVLLSFLYSLLLEEGPFRRKLKNLDLRSFLRRYLNSETNKSDGALALIAEITKRYLEGAKNFKKFINVLFRDLSGMADKSGVVPALRTLMDCQPKFLKVSENRVRLMQRLALNAPTSGDFKSMVAAMLKNLIAEEEKYQSSILEDMKKLVREKFEE